MAPIRCEKIQAIAERLDAAIIAEKYKSQYLTSKKMRAEARHEWEKGKRVRNKTINAHVDSCHICEPPQIQPVRCPSYTRYADNFDKQLEDANRQMEDAESLQEKSLAQIAISRATNGKEVVLIAHVLECSMCE